MSNLKSTVSGRCLCGEVRFETDAEALWCAHCHCTMCQLAHGAAFVTWVGYPADSVDLVEANLQWYRSSEEGERGFCRQCGTTLFFRSSNWPGELHVARSLIAETPDLRPSGHAFYDTHVTWVSQFDDLPVV